MVRFAASVQDLGMRRRYVNLYLVVECKGRRGAVAIQTFFCCRCQEGLVGCSEGVKRLDRDAQGGGEFGR